MNLAVIILLFALGVAVIVRGGDLFVDAATWIAEVSGIPSVIVGATVVSIATTMPEMIVSALAAGQGKVDMAIGNAIGSVTANSGLIMALSLLFIPMAIERRSWSLRSALLLASIAALGLCALDGRLTIPRSAVLIALFALFIIHNVRGARRSGSGAGRPPLTRQTVAANAVRFVLGAAGVVIGSHLLVDNGSALAAALGVPEKVIAVTFVSIGTSLPELVTAVAAIVRKEASLSVGNIIGANILDITLILPLCAAVSGGALPVARQTLALDIPVCLGISALALVPTLIAGRFSRWQGALCLGAYAVYLTVTCL